MASPIASVLSAQGGRYGSSGPKAKSSRITMFGNTSAVQPAPTSTGSNAGFGSASGYVGVPTAAPYAPVVPVTPPPLPRPIGRVPPPPLPPPVVGPPPVGVGTGVGPTPPPPSGTPPSIDPGRYVGPGTTPPPVGIGVAPIGGNGSSLSDAVRGSAGTSPGPSNGNPTSTTGPGRPGANNGGSLSGAVRASAGTSPGPPSGNPTSIIGPGRPGASTTPPGRRVGGGGLGPSTAGGLGPPRSGTGTGVAPLPGAPYGNSGGSLSDLVRAASGGSPGGASGEPTSIVGPGRPGAQAPSGGTNPSDAFSDMLDRIFRDWQMRYGHPGADVPWGDTSPTDPGQPGGPPQERTNYVQPVSAVEIAGQNLPGEQAYYDNQIARRSRGLFDTAEAKTNYGLERLEDRGMGQSSVAGQVAAENYGQYARDADAAAADVQAKQFSSREQRMADARKFEFDKALQAAQYALAQKDENGQTDEQQLQAALAMFGQAFGSGGYAGLYGNQYQQGR